MKKILLASAASFAFAGAAAADITFSGSANVGFGDLVEKFEDNNGNNIAHHTLQLGRRN